MNLGDFRLFSLSDGFFTLDPAATLDPARRPDAAHARPRDERTRIRLALRPLLIVTPTDRILVDAGIGDKGKAELGGRYRVERTDTLTASLGRAGFAPEDVTKVVLTHLHLDHCGGATRLGEDGRPTPSFPNARHYVQKKEWDAAVNPDRRSRAAYMPDSFLPLQDAGQLELIDGDVRLEPGLELVLTGGHSPGHQIVLVKTGSGGQGLAGSSLVDPNPGTPEPRNPLSGTAVYWSDLVPTGSHIATPYIIGYDWLPLDTMAQKERLVRQAVSGQWISFLGHDPDNACGIICEESGRHFLKPLAV